MSGKPPYAVLAGREESTGHPTLESAVDTARDMDRAGCDDPIQVVDAGGTIILEGGDLTDRLMGGGGD